MKAKFYYLFLFCFLSLTDLSGQTTSVTIAGEDFQDASIRLDTRPGREYVGNTNYKTLNRVTATAWTASGYRTYGRTLLYFDLNDFIPPKSSIQSATLYFYSDPAVTSSSLEIGNSQLSGSNAFYLEKVTQEWDESTVTWNNQPSTTTTGRIWVGPSAATTENRQVNITPMVQGWINDPITNNGIKMLLENENYYRSRNYGSTDHSNSAIRPKLVIVFTPTSTANICGIPELTEEEAVALPWYGNETFLPAFNDSLNQIYGNSSPNARVTNDIETPWLRIKTRLWIYQIGVGNPGGIVNQFPDEFRIQRLMDNINDAARNNGLKLRFYLSGVTFVNDANAINVENAVEERVLAETYKDVQALNIHIVDALSDAVGKFNPFYNAIFIDRSVANSSGDASTFTHEIGHFLGLQHTHFFFGRLCFREPVTRGIKLTPCPNGGGFTKRCLYTGDFLCDTDADPNMSVVGSYNFSNCTWNPNGAKDQYGETYHPDQRNFMAYGNNSCENHFSASQVFVMHYFAFKRQYSQTWVLSGNNRFDRYEPDEGDIAARAISVGSIQSHTFHTAGRTDNVDWLSFQYPSSGSLNNYQVIITQVSPSAVGAINIYIRQPNNRAGARVTGITSSTSGNVVTYNIPCNLLTPGANYLIEVPRGASGNTDYDIELRGNQNTQAIISGPNTVCNSGTFTVSNVPTGAAINWVHSSHLTPVSGQGTTSFTVAKNFSGNGSVGVFFSGTCGNSNTVTIPVRVGEFSPSEYSISGQTVLCPNQTASYYVYNVPGATNFQWFWPSDWTLLGGQGTSTLDLMTGSNASGWSQVEVSVSNVCGQGSFAVLETFVEDCGQYYIMSTPNPTTTQLTVELVETVPGNNQIDWIEILDGNGNSLNRWLVEAKKVSLDVTTIPKGYCYLKTTIRGKVSTTRIVIE